jgi:D-alanyl-D-alanine carboxypeptidase/D-alanyl-D-alanine carboxypeptidase (penicillin-binding protein 5/6)
LSKFKIQIINFLLILFFIFYFSLVKIEGFDVSAKSAIIICADSGDVIWEKNANQPRAMASTTKIMTSLLALEEAAARGNRDLEITEEMVRVEGTLMGLAAGDVVNLETLAAGMLLPSGNDAANAAAISVSGTTEKFIELMNERAKQIGMTDTKFCTPSGLDFSDHHSTASDMAILGAYAMENKCFASIVSQKYKKINFTSPEKVIRLENHNKLLKLYEYCIGIKTGFTKKAGRCLVSCAEKDKVRLVAVTLDASDDWNDHITLYNHGFSAVTVRIFDERGFETEIPVIGGEIQNLKIIGTTKFKRTFKSGAESNVRRIVEIPEGLNAPVEKGSAVGVVSYFLENKKIGENILTASEDVKIQKRRNIFQKIFDFFKNLVHS